MMFQDAKAVITGEPPFNEPSVLGDLGPHGAPGVEPPVVEPLGPGGKGMSVVSADRLLQYRVLTCLIRCQILTRLLGGSSKEGSSG